MLKALERTSGLLLAGGLVLSGCVATPAPDPQRPSEPVASSPDPAPATAPPVAAPVDFQLTPSGFADLPGWASADLAPPLAALQRQCSVWRLRPPDAPLGQGRYGGVLSDWLPACAIADTIQPGQERWFFESYFMPMSVSGPGEAKLTAYFEPVIEARRMPEGAYTEPLLRRPSDMVTVDLGAFAEARDDNALRGGPRALTGRLTGDRVEPYPKREAIAPGPGQIIAWAHPADVYNLQVQGSGRLRFPDGSQTRAAFAAQNGYRWVSALGALRSTGALAAASWASFRLWLDNNPERIRSALNADPSYVFFAEEIILDPAIGPRGSAGVPLTPMASIAVDPAYHPYGGLVFVDGTYNNAPFQRLMVAQDTGGAIRRGPLRGDVFWGTGPAAGLEAERMNAPARWWTLLPRPADIPVASLSGVARAAP
jgi:membrane-bound lytic murein transglycosylase A